MSFSPTSDKKHEPCTPPNASAEVNMEVAVSTDNVMRAGGSTDVDEHVGEESEDGITQERSDPMYGKDIDSGKEEEAPESQDASEAVNMEASVSRDEVVRAGGFGATDNISSFLPVASDFTDYEANLRDARDYEDSQEGTNRPGLGWRSETN